MKVFDLFAGGGGFRQGAEKAGMEIAGFKNLKDFFLADCVSREWQEEVNKLKAENESFDRDINVLSKKLHLATDALENISDGYSKDTCAGETAREALDQIKGESE